MAKKYKIGEAPVMRVEEMSVVSATELKNATADVFERVAAERALVIQRHEKPRAVLLSMEAYGDLVGDQEPLYMQELKARYGKMLDDMQSPEQKAAADRAFEATPEELGEAAVRAAQEKIAKGEIKL